MKMFSDCSGECALCACAGFCLAGHGDDDFSFADTDQIIDRLNKGKYADHKELMISFLRQCGITYDEKQFGKDKNTEEQTTKQPDNESFDNFSYSKARQPLKEVKMQIDADIYDKETTIHGCTVQILENTVTGKTSVGWWRNEEDE